MNYNFLKSQLDKFTALVLLLFLFPFLIIISILVYLFIGNPILFKQLRPGFKGLPFTIFKFRTMNNKKYKDGNLLPDNQRITKFGSLLRSYSIDELPELLNIIKGEMSFVGPRPLRMEYLESYSKREFKRHDVLPGLTGLAQINGRNILSWQEKFELDLTYVKKQSFILDLKILLLTIKIVLFRKGISPEGENFMPFFKK